MRAKALAGILSALLLTGWFSLEDEKKKPEPEAPSIALHEAEILIYLLPVSKQLRGKGLEVAWELLDRPGLNQEDYYNFSVFPAAGEGSPMKYALARPAWVMLKRASRMATAITKK